MNSRVRIGLLIAIGGFFVIALGVFLAIRMLNLGKVIAGAPPPTPEAENTGTVAFATGDVIAGAVLTPEDVTLSKIPIQFAPRDTITVLENAVGKISKTDLFAGEMILEHNLANPTSVVGDVAYVLDERHVLMAVPATDLMSREAIIKRGDIVDILVSYPETLNPVGGTETDVAPQQVTFTAFQRLDITALVVDIVQDQNASQEENATPTREQTAVQAYLVALDPQDALVLKYLKDIGGTFDFVLRAPTSSGQFDLTPVTAKFIKELYGLELLP